MAESSGNKIKAFIIWEPILRTDFAPPGRNALARIADKRAAQFWDPDHRYALELRKKLATDAQHPQPSCCDTENVPWDLILVYPPGAKWDAELPRATYADGPVYQLKPALRKAFREAQQTTPPSR